MQREEAIAKFREQEAELRQLGRGAAAGDERDRDQWRRNGRPLSAPSALRWSRASRRSTAAAYNRAVEVLLPVRFGLWQIDGSHAQRDVVDWTLTEAAVRGGRRDVALSLAHERLGTRPRSAPNRRFLRHAEVIVG